MIDFHSQLEQQFPNKNYIPECYESATLQDNLEHSGGITLSWKAASHAEIPLGAYITYEDIRYILLEPYAPTKESAIHWHYNPTFKHPQNMLDRIPFWVKSLDASGTPVNLQTTSFTGYPETIVAKLCSFINTEYVRETSDSFFASTVGTGWRFSIPNANNEKHAIITVAFDGCSIKSAADRIGDAMGCNVFFDWSAKVIRFVVGTTIQGEVYNTFHVLGGTKNMGKTTVSGGFAAVTQRLTLPDSYKGSIISYAENNGIRLTTDLIFDEIYPKQELFIKTARQRLCYLTDNESGEFIVDHWEKDGVVVPQDTKGAKPVFKTFAKWYVTLATDRELQNDYVFNQEYLIKDKPLGLLFQIDDQQMPNLVGHEFELTYFPEAKEEYDRNDAEATAEEPFVISAHEYYIACKAVGEMLLPTTLTDGAGLVPRVKDKVTLVNMALNDEQKGIAKRELLAAAQEIIGAMMAQKGEYTETVLNAQGIAIGGASPFTSDHGPIVTNINQNLDTGVAEVTVGSWSRKTKTGGTVDKLETVTVSASNPTEGDGGLGGNSSKTIGQTLLKPDSLFSVVLGNSMDVVSCDSDGKTKVATDVITKVTGFYGNRDVTASCAILYTSDLPAGVTIYQESSLPEVDTEDGEEPGTPQWTGTRMEKDTEVALDNGSWLRIHFDEGIAFGDKLVIDFVGSHPSFSDRDVAMTIQCMRPGESRIGIDLDNDADVVSIDENGKVRFDRTVVTNAYIYEGGSIVTSGVTKPDSLTPASLKIGGCEPTISNVVDGQVTITWEFEEGVSATSAEKTVSLTYKNRTYSTTFSLVALDSASIYQLQPSLKAISFARVANDNSLTPASRDLTLSVVKFDGQGTENLDSCPAGYSVKYAYDNEINGYNDGFSWPVSSNKFQKLTITNDTSYKYVYIALFYHSGTKYIKVDNETIPVIKDGFNGDGIVSVTRTYNISSIDSTESETEGPRDISVWFPSSPAVNEAKPYLWAREAVTYKYQSATVKFYMIGARGQNGIDAQDIEWAYIRTKTNVAPVIADDSAYTDSNSKKYTSDDHLPHVTGNSNVENNHNTYECTDDPKGVDFTWKYEWEIKREKGSADNNGHRAWVAYSGTMTLHNNLSESALVIDIDNDSDQFGVDSEGAVVTQQQKITKVTMLYGTAEQAFTSKPTATMKYDDGSTVNSSVATVAIAVVPNTDYKQYIVTVTINATGSNTPVFTKNGKNGLYVDISGTCAKGTKSIRFTLEKVMSGKKGEDPVIYQLNPTSKSFSFARNETNNELTPTEKSSTINVLQTIGNNTTPITSATAGLTYSWGFDNETPEYSGLAIGTSVSVSNTDAANHTHVWVKLSTGDTETLPIVKDGANGANADVPMQAFQWNSSPITAPSPLPSGATLGNWSSTAPNRPTSAGEHFLWMTQTTKHTAKNGTVTYDNWSSAVRISGDTGDAGEDAKEREWIYRGSTTQSTPTGYDRKEGTANGQAVSGKTGNDWNADLTDDFVPTNWSDNAIATDDTTNKFVYASWRDWNKTTGKWGDFNTPILWSNWGRQGIDGDGVQYIYKLFANELTDAQRTNEIPDNATFNSTTGEWMPSDTTGKNADWYDNPQATTQSTPFCYCSVIKKINGAWETLSTGKGKFGKLGLWSKWSADGESTLIADIDNEMDSIICEDGGHAMLKKDGTLQSVSTVANLYLGSSKQSCSIYSVKRNGTTLTSGIASNGVKAEFPSESGVDRTISIAYDGTAVINNGKDDYEIVINDGSNSWTLHFTVNREREYVYNVKPCGSSIVAHRKNDGTFEITGIKCGYTMRNLDNSITIVEEVTETQDGTSSDPNHNKLFVDGRYNIWYHKRLRSTGDWEKHDSTTYGWHEYHCNYAKYPSEGYPGITENFDPNVYDAVEFVLCTEIQNYRAKNELNGVIDRETVYVVADGADGADGKNSVRIDLDNQADMVSVDTNGKVRFDHTVTVNAKIYDGSTPVTSNDKITHSMTATSLKIGSRNAETPTKSGGCVTVQWKFKKGDTVSATPVTITLRYNSVDYSAVFTLGTTDSEAFYQLLPSRDSINFTRQADGSLTPDVIYPYCGYVKYTGSGAESHPLQYDVTQSEIFNFDNSGYAIWCRLLNADGTIYIWDASTSPYGWIWMNSMPSRSIGKNTTYSAIQFCIGPANSDRTKWSDADIIDLETVPIIKDGVNGTSPWVADLDNEMDSVSCDDSGYVNTNSFVRVSTNIGLYYGNSQKAIKYSTSTSGNYKTVTSVTVKRNGTTIPLNAFDALENKITNNVYLILASNYKTISVAYLSGAKITGKDDFEITIIAADDQSVQRTLHFTVNGIIGDVYNLLPSANEIIAIRNANGTFNTTGIKCGYTKRAVDGTITRVEDVDETHTGEPSGGYPLYVDGKYNIWYHRRVRSTGEWEKYTGGTYAGRYIFSAYNYESNRNAIVNNFNPNTYDAVEFILCTETGNGRAKEENKLIGEVDRETVYVVSNGSIPSYIETQEAWSNQPAAPSTGPTDCNESDWKNSTPENTGNKAYLWRRSRQMTLNADGISYTAGTWTYIRLNGTNGTSINVKGSVKYVKDSSSSFPTSGVSTNDLAIVKTQAQLYKYNSSWSKSGPTAVDGDSYTNDDDRHLWMWSSEANKWIDLGEFKGESGKTYYTHVAWAKGITKGQQTARKPGQTNTPNATACTAFSISPMDGYDWMGILIDTDVNDASGTDAWKYYTWSYVKGADGTDGENSIRLALDNQHEDFKYNDNGDLIAPTSGATSVIRLYDGEAEVTNFTLQISATSGCTPSTSTSVADRAYISEKVLYVKGISQGSQSAWVRVMAHYNGEYYYAKFTANKTSGDKYDLFVTPSSIAYNSATYATQTISFEAKGTDDTGNQYDVTITSGSASPVAGNFYIFYGYVQSDGKIVKPSNPSSRGVEQLTTATFSAISLIASSYVGIYFVLRKYSSSTYYRVCDYETVEIAKSANGTNGTNGTNGKDGYTVTCEPASLVINQNDSGTYDISANNPAYFKPKVTKGNSTADLVASVSVKRNYCVKNTSTSIVNCEAWTSANGIPVTGVNSIAINNKYTQGYLELSVTADSKTFSITIPIAVNYLGSYIETIVDGKKEVIARQVITTITQEGTFVVNDATYQQVKTAAEAFDQWASSYQREYGESINYLNTRISTAEGNISTVERKVNSGKNLLRGVLTAAGWQSVNQSMGDVHNAVLSSDDWITINNSSDWYLVSPQFNIENGKKYTISFDAEGTSSIAIIVFTTSMTAVVSKNTSAASRRVATFTSNTTGGVKLFIHVNKVKNPQVEIGETATSFDAGATEISSQISQTADEIRLEVENTGIDITNGLISLRGGKVAIEDSVSVPTVLSENDDMYTQINAGRLEIRSKTTQSYGLFEINNDGEVILSMFDKDGKCIINLGGTSLTMVNGEWIVWKLRQRNPGGDKDYYTTTDSQCTTYYQLKLGYLYNARTGMKYFLPPSSPSEGGQEVSDNTFITNYNNKVYQGTSYTVSGIQGLSKIANGYYIKANNGRFNVDANQQGPTNYWIDMYYFEGGLLKGTVKQQFSF